MIFYIYIKKYLALNSNILKISERYTDIISTVKKRRINMNELNLSLAENLGDFFSAVQEDVVRGIQEYLATNNSLSFEVI